MIGVLASESLKAEASRSVTGLKGTGIEVGECVYGFYCGFTKDSERPHNDLGYN